MSFLAIFRNWCRKILISSGLIWFTKIDLKNAYVYFSVILKPRRFSRFAFQWIADKCNKLCSFSQFPIPLWNVWKQRHLHISIVQLRNIIVLLKQTQDLQFIRRRQTSDAYYVGRGGQRSATRDMKHFSPTKPVTATLSAQYIQPVAYCNF